MHETWTLEESVAYLRWVGTQEIVTPAMEETMREVLVFLVEHQIEQERTLERHAQALEEHGASLEHHAALLSRVLADNDLLRAENDALRADNDLLRAKLALVGRSGAVASEPVYCPRCQCLVVPARDGERLVCPHCGSVVPTPISSEQRNIMVATDQ